MPLQQEIDKEVRKFGKKLAVYLKANLEEALIKGAKRGHSNPEEARLSFAPQLIPTDNGVKLQIIACDRGDINRPVEYWINIEEGRRPGKMPPPHVVGEKWQNKNNINAKKVYLEIQANYKRRTGISSVPRRLSSTKKKISYEEYAKRLSFIFARAIERDGITPKPFVQQAIQDAKVDEFQKRISEIMKKEITVDLALNSSVKPIKITF